MKCQECYTSVFKTPLKRINPKGEVGIWWCQRCIDSKEPELGRNLKEDESQIEKDLSSIIYKDDN